MRKHSTVFLLAAMAASIADCALAADRCTSAEAKTMADKAIAAVKAQGPEKAYGEFSQKDNAAWHNKDCYVFVVKYDGSVGAHGGNPALVGKNVIEMKDADGEPFQKKMIEQSKKGPGWVDYKWSNPLTKEIAPKSTYVLPIAGQDALLGVGVYK